MRKYEGRVKNPDLELLQELRVEEKRLAGLVKSSRAAVGQIAAAGYDTVVHMQGHNVYSKNEWTVREKYKVPNVGGKYVLGVQGIKSDPRWHTQMPDQLWQHFPRRVSVRSVELELDERDFSAGALAPLARMSITTEGRASYRSIRTIYPKPLGDPRDPAYNMYYELRRFYTSPRAMFNDIGTQCCNALGIAAVVGEAFNDAYGSEIDVSQAAVVTQQWQAKGKEEENLLFIDSSLTKILPASFTEQVFASAA